MTRSTVRFCAAALLSFGLGQAATAQETSDSDEVKGVNPAEVFSRADLIVKAINTKNGEVISTILKYDKKIADGVGANIEFNALSYARDGDHDAFGNGDLFFRLRYVKPLTQSLVGLTSVELAVPTASNDMLGSGKWQLNPAVGIVKIWNQRNFTAILYKRSWSFAGDDDRFDIRVNQLRALHSIILNKGYYLTVDGRREWQTKGFNQHWTTAEFEVGRQFNARFAGSIRIGKTWGDRANDGAIDVNVRTFF